MLISISLLMLTLLPFFQFIVKVFATQNIYSQTKETLEIASLATYTKINQDMLGSGVMNIDILLAKSILNEQARLLFEEKPGIKIINGPIVSIENTFDKITISCEIVVLTPFENSNPVKSSLEFIVDPTMEETG